jgi:ATP-binding cassette subfamily B protein
MMNLFRSKAIKWVKQHDSMQCGVACLSMICRHYGKEYSLEYLDGFCHANVSGVSMLGIADGAACVGLQTMTAAAATHELGDIKLPCILHWNQEHFVVLYEISKNGKWYKVADPGKGLITYTKKEFESHWLSSMTDGEPSGIVMQLIPTEKFYKHDYEKKEEKRSFRFLFGYLKQYRRYFTV